MRGILRVVIDLLGRDHFVRGKADVVLTRIQVSQIVRIIAAGNFDSNSVPGKKPVSGRSPEFNQIRIEEIPSTFRVPRVCLSVESR